MSNGQAWEIRKEIESVIYYLKCKICNEKEIYILGNNWRQYEGI